MDACGDGPIICLGANGTREMRDATGAFGGLVWKRFAGRGRWGWGSWRGSKLIEWVEFLCSIFR
jgi:hypothetical protein